MKSKLVLFTYIYQIIYLDTIFFSQFFDNQNSKKYKTRASISSSFMKSSLNPGYGVWGHHASGPSLPLHH